MNLTHYLLRAAGARLNLQGISLRDKSLMPICRDENEPLSQRAITMRHPYSIDSASDDAQFSVHRSSGTRAAVLEPAPHEIFVRSNQDGKNVQRNV